MTAAKPNHLAARRLLLDHLDLHPGKTVNADLDPLEAGIVGDTDHAHGGDSYHLGAGQIRARAGRARYSVDESTRDQRGLDNYASAMDVGYFAVTVAGRAWDLYDFNAWLLRLINDQDPDTADLREVIYSPDGATVRRWDRLGLRSTGDSSHRTHTHLSEHRDADGHRMVLLARRWLTHIGLIEGDDDMNAAEMTAWANSPAGQAALAKAAQQDIGTQLLTALKDPEVARQLGALPWKQLVGKTGRSAHNVLFGDMMALLAKAAGDDADEQAIATAVLAGMDYRAIATLVVDALPADQAQDFLDAVAARLQG